MMIRFDVKVYLALEGCVLQFLMFKASILCKLMLKFSYSVLSLFNTHQVFQHSESHLSVIPLGLSLKNKTPNKTLLQPSTFQSQQHWCTWKTSCVRCLENEYREGVDGSSVLQSVKYIIKQCLKWISLTALIPNSTHNQIILLILYFSGTRLETNQRNSLNGFFSNGN